MSGLRKTKRPFGLVRKLDDIETVPLDTLSPAELNDAVYKPIDHNDPDVIALAKLIREQGLLEPLVITLDDVILSGHRRRVACQMAGIDRVKVRRHPIRSTDPGFAELLVSYNAQRVKSVDEQVREAVVLTDKKKAYQNLLRHRRERSNEISDGAFRKGMTEIADTDARRRSEISPAKFPMLNAAIAVLNANRDYWPLTLRQVHYRLLNDPPLRNADRPESTYANDLKSYKDLSNLLARARIAGNISWHALHDPTLSLIHI